MATQPEPVAGVAFVDSPSLILPAPYPTLVSSGGTLGVIAAGSSTVSPIGGGDTSWFGLEAAYHASIVTQLTESTPIVLGVSNEGAILSASAVDAGAEGGALRGNSDTAWIQINKATVVQGMNTSKFAISFQGTLSPIAVGKLSYFGLFNAPTSTSKEIVIGTQQSTDAANFVGFVYDGVGLTSVPLGTSDGQCYTWRILSDGTTLSYQRAAKGGGGAALSSGTIATSTAHFPTGAAYVGFQNSAGTTGQQLFKCLVSYVGP